MGPNRSYSASSDMNYSGSNVDRFEVTSKEKNPTEKLNAVKTSNCQRRSVIIPTPTISQCVQQHSSSAQCTPSSPMFITNVQLGNNARTSTFQQNASKSPLEKQEIKIFEEMTIQGDPLLSESSSVIGVLKDTENSSVEICEKVTMQYSNEKITANKNDDWTNNLTMFT